MSFDAIRARTQARKAAGANQTYPEHAGKTPGRRALPVLTPCPDLGEKLRGGCGTTLYRCNRFGDKTARFGACRDADRYCSACEYHPARREAKTPAFFSVPALAPLTLPPPASPRAVVTVVTDAAQDMHALTVSTQAAYAARLGADYVVLRDESPVPGFPIGAKFRLGLVLDWYERVAFLDADAVPMPGCPDLFAECGEGELGFHDDLPDLRRLNHHLGLVREYAELRGAVGFTESECLFIANTGVLVFSRAHRDALAPPAPELSLPRRHCAEQSWYTARWHDLTIKRRSLRPECNYQYWANNEFLGMPRRPAAIVHFSGIVPHKSSEERVAIMRRFLSD